MRGYPFLLEIKSLKYLLDMEEKRWVMIDNFDSFVYNLKAYFQEQERSWVTCDETWRSGVSKPKVNSSFFLLRDRKLCVRDGKLLGGDTVKSLREGFWCWCVCGDIDWAVWGWVGVGGVSHDGKSNRSTTTEQECAGCWRNIYRYIPLNV